MTSPLNYDGGLTIAFQVSDLERAQAWYANVLGFRPLYSLAEMGWCELATEIPGVHVGLSQVESPQVAAGPVPTFGVKDIEAARSLLEAREVRFDGPTQEIPKMVRLATFFDPDGNALMLFQDLQQDSAS